MRKSCNTSKSYKIHFCQLKCTAACQNAYSDQVFASLSMLYLQICTTVQFCICICTTSTKVPGCNCRRAPSDSIVAFFLRNFAPQALVHVLLVFSTLEWSRWGVESVHSMFSEVTLDEWSSILSSHLTSVAQTDWRLRGSVDLCKRTWYQLLIKLLHR